MKKTNLICMLLFLGNLLNAQQYNDFLGAGHQQGITVTTSSSQQADNQGDKTVDGFPVTDKLSLKDASRFLAQASLGYDYEIIQSVASMGYEAWIEEQFGLPRTKSEDIVKGFNSFLGAEAEELAGMTGFRAAWWNLVLKNPDLLRQRVTYALSQIFVISSFGSDLFEDVGQLSTVYYDLLSQHAFGNYRDMLGAISRNPSMGLYLSHMNNPKSDPANNIHPDENYAREVMQLFSIGLYELNNDGSRKLDANGKYIPTYDNNDIREFAKIFTGFGDGRPNGSFGFFDDEEREIARLPMRMYDEHHEPGPKYLLNGKVVPAGQTGLKDFNDAIDNLFNHPNVGPFIGKALIQFLITSNPSPAYINRVAAAFNNNGQGQRGDFKAVIKAILLDPEARNCSPLNNPTSGKLREPMVRYTGHLKAFNVTTNAPLFIDFMEKWYNNTGQIPLYASSVFNFYQPAFQPNGPVADQNLVAPVFQIHNSSTSVGFVNEVDDWLFSNQFFDSFDEEEEEDEEQINQNQSLTLDYSDELALVNNPTALVDRLDILLACGQLTENTKSIIVDAVTQTSGDENKLDMAIYLITISPEYAFLK